MALKPVPIMTTGADHDAQMFRMMLKDLARDSEGVTTGLDLKVSALDTPGAGVKISDGSGIIAGRKSTTQGSYSAYNVGTDTCLVAATGSTARSDMIVLRVEDPEFEGTRDPAVDPIVFWEVIPNVSSTATSVPAGYSAIPLARIDLPASTATITSAMIKDLRKVANPRTDLNFYPYFAPNPAVYLSGTSETWQDFPSSAKWTIAVPAWAARVKIKFDVGCLGLDTGNVFGSLTFNFGGKEAAQWISIDDNQGTAFRRNTLIMADTLSLTDTLGAPLRGTNVTLKARMRARAENQGRMIVDGATTFIATVAFEEGSI